ncbi:MAG: hypothetical protein ACR2JI_09665 [Mycobacterium sp.]
MPAQIVTACAGFLLAVLWMDLMFDSQVRTTDRDNPLDERVLASIAGYYQRATTTSQPMGSAIAAVMIALVATLGVEAFRGATPAPILALGAVLAGGPILLALTRTVPNAVRLGHRSGSTAEQSRLARAVFRDHLICAIGMFAFLVLRIVAGVG